MFIYDIGMMFIYDIGMMFIYDIGMMFIVHNVRHGIQEFAKSCLSVFMKDLNFWNQSML